MPLAVFWSTQNHQTIHQRFQEVRWRSSWSFEGLKFCRLEFFSSTLAGLKGRSLGYAVDFCNWLVTKFAMKTCQVQVQFSDIFSFSHPSTVHDQSIVCHTSYSLFDLLSTSQTPLLIIKNDIHRIHSRRNMHIYNSLFTTIRSFQSWILNNQSRSLKVDCLDWQHQWYDNDTAILLWRYHQHQVGHHFLKIKAMTWEW